MKIEVTTDDIKNGEPNNCNMCAVSMALQRYFKTDDTWTKADFDTGEIFLEVNKKDYKVKDTDQYIVGDFIDRFDNMDDIDFFSPKPIQFEIEEIKK